MGDGGGGGGGRTGDGGMQARSGGVYQNYIYKVTQIY